MHLQTHSYIQDIKGYNEHLSSKLNTANWVYIQKKIFGISHVVFEFAKIILSFLQQITVKNIMILRTQFTYSWYKTKQNKRKTKTKQKETSIFLLKWMHQSEEIYKQVRYRSHSFWDCQKSTLNLNNQLQQVPYTHVMISCTLYTHAGPKKKKKKKPNQHLFLFYFFFWTECIKQTIYSNKFGIGHAVFEIAKKLFSDLSTTTFL